MRFKFLAVAVASLVAAGQSQADDVPKTCPLCPQALITTPFQSPAIVKATEGQASTSCSGCVGSKRHRLIGLFANRPGLFHKRCR